MSKTMPKLSLSFLFLAFLSASSSSSATRIGFSYDAATNAEISSTRDTLSFSVFRFPIKAIPMEEEINREEEEIFRYSHRKLISAPEHDSFNPQSPTTIPQVTPVPNIVTVPSMNPVTMTPLNPATNPLTVPTTAPPTNPVTSPSLVPPVSNQVPPAFTVPMAPPNTGTPITPPVNPVTPPATTNPPTTSGQVWCVAKTGAPANALQAGLDYACGLGGADCSAIQASGSCYNPNNPQGHASYAFNSYYQKNPVPSSCDFKGAATLVNTNPSSASCIYPSSSSSPAGTPSTLSPPATPTTSSPPATTPTTLSPPATPTALSPPATISSPNEPPPTTPTTNTPPATTSPNFPPFMLNSSNPGSPTPAIYGSSPPPGASSSVSTATSMQPLFAPILLVSLILTGRLCVM